jgi:methylenetetrahydrofolate reductase (NADPH)
MPSDHPVALEITPPRRPRHEILLRRARTIGGRAARLNVIQRPDRWSSLDASIALIEHGIEPVWHLTNRGRSVEDIEADIGRAASAAVTRVLCLRGEHKADDGMDAPKIREVVRRVRRGLPTAHVSVTLNHHLGSSRVWPNLDAKLSAGAQGVQTQVTFDLNSLADRAEQIKAHHPTVSITPMLMPVLSVRSAVRLSRRLAIPLPPALLQRLEVAGPDAGWEHFASFARAVVDSSLYEGLAIMTPIDPDAEFGARLRSVLDEIHPTARGRSRGCCCG